VQGQARCPGQCSRFPPGTPATVTGQESLTIRAAAPSELILVEAPLELKRVGVWSGALL
jgi:hypothetical protein